MSKISLYVDNKLQSTQSIARGLKLSHTAFMGYLRAGGINNKDVFHPSDIPSYKGKATRHQVADKRRFSF